MSTGPAESEPGEGSLEPEGEQEEGEHGTAPAVVGAPGDVVAPGDETPPLSPRTGTGRWGSREAEVLNVEFLDQEGRTTGMVEFGEEVTVRIHYVAHEPLDRPNFGLAAWSEQGWPIGAPNTRLSGIDTGTGTVRGEGWVDFRMERCPFVPGRVAVSAAITDHSTLHVYDWWDRAFELKVVPSHGVAPTGLIEIPGRWQGPGQA